MSPYLAFVIIVGGMWVALACPVILLAGATCVVSPSSMIDVTRYVFNTSGDGNALARTYYELLSVIGVNDWVNYGLNPYTRSQCVSDHWMPVTYVSLLVFPSLMLFSAICHAFGWLFSKSLSFMWTK